MLSYKLPQNSVAWNNDVIFPMILLVGWVVPLLIYPGLTYIWLHRVPGLAVLRWPQSHVGSWCWLEAGASLFSACECSSFGWLDQLFTWWYLCSKRAVYFLFLNYFIEVWLTYKKLYVFNVYNSIGLGISIHLWNHHHHQDHKYIHCFPKISPAIIIIIINL